MDDANPILGDKATHPFLSIKTNAVDGVLALSKAV
jgi:hypothetical protein